MLLQTVDGFCTCRLLQTSLSRNLGLAHLSYCSPHNSTTGHMQYMKMNPSMTLRYGTYVETSAPLFGWWFLQQFVLDTLVEAETGDHGICVQQPDACRPVSAALAITRAMWITVHYMYIIGCNAMMACVTVSHYRVESVL